MTDTWLGEIIHRSARNNPQGRALVDGGRSVTNLEYLARCQALAAALLQRGVRRMDRVAVLSMNRLECKEATGACELAGFLAATVNFRLTATELRAQLRDCAPAALFFEGQYADLVNEVRGDVPSIRTWVCIDEPPTWAMAHEALLAEGAGQVPGATSTIEDPAYLVYTSGSTGRPKGCILGSRELARKAEQHASDLGITSIDRVLVVMPLFHVGAQSICAAGQWQGAEVHILRSFDPAEYIRTVEEQKITVAHLAPTMIQMIVDHPAAATADFSSLRSVLYSAAAMPAEVLRKAIATLGPVFIQAYGQTEGIVSLLPRHQHRPDGTPAERARLLSVGQPYPGVEVRLLDDDGKEVPQGQPGEIVYRGGAMFRGYWNDHVTTLATWRDGWISSGDIGLFDADGFLFIVDRKKDMIITGGENVASREVEEALLGHPEISEVAVIGVPHPKWGETIHAVAVRAQGSTVDEAAVIAHARGCLASYKKPTGVTFVERLPTLANGKIDKVSLRAQVSAAKAEG